jgi:hypothetical protein
MFSWAPHLDGVVPMGTVRYTGVQGSLSNIIVRCALQHIKTQPPHVQQYTCGAAVHFLCNPPLNTLCLPAHVCCVTPLRGCWRLPL